MNGPGRASSVFTGRSEVPGNFGRSAHHPRHGLEGTFVSTARPPGGRKIQGRGLPRPELMVSASGTRIPRVLHAAARDPDPPPSKDQGLARAVLPATPAS